MKTMFNKILRVGLTSYFMAGSISFYYIGHDGANASKYFKEQPSLIRETMDILHDPHTHPNSHSFFKVKPQVGATGVTNAVSAAIYT